MPTNLTPTIRNRKRKLGKEIPNDLLAMLSVGPDFVRPPGERPSDLYGFVIYFGTDKEQLEAMEQIWKQHEKLIRAQVEGEPYILDRMKRLRKYIDLGRDLEAAE